jgi:hypothetical protein
MSIEIFDSPHKRLPDDVSQEMAFGNLEPMTNWLRKYY